MQGTYITLRNGKQGLLVVGEAYPDVQVNLGGSFRRVGKVFWTGPDRKNPEQIVSICSAQPILSMPSPRRPGRTFKRRRTWRDDCDATNGVDRCRGL